MRRAIGVGVLLSAAVLVLASIAFARPNATSVAVTMGKPGELRFTLSRRSAPKGLVTFSTINRGMLMHDFKIAGKKTPLLLKGKRAVLKVTFRKAGKYRYLCTVPGHAEAGMKGIFVIK